MVRGLPILLGVVALAVLGVVPVMALSMGSTPQAITIPPGIICTGPPPPPWHPGMPPIWQPQIVICKLPPGMINQIEALLEYAQEHGIKPLWLGPNGLVGITSNGNIVVIPLSQS